MHRNSALFLFSNNTNHILVLWLFSGRYSFYHYTFAFFCHTFHYLSLHYLNSYILTPPLRTLKFKLDRNYHKWLCRGHVKKETESLSISSKDYVQATKMEYLPNMHKSRSRDMRTRNNEQSRRGLCSRNVKRETEPLNVNIKNFRQQKQNFY